MISSFSRAYLITDLEKEKNAFPVLKENWEKSSNQLWDTLYKSSGKPIPDWDHIQLVYRSTGTALKVKKARIDYLEEQIEKKMIRPIKRVRVFYM